MNPKNTWFQEFRTATVVGSLIGFLISLLLFNQFPLGSLFTLFLVSGMWIGSKLSDPPKSEPDDEDEPTVWTAKD